MESRVENATSPQFHGLTTDKLVKELKSIVQRAEEKAVDRAKAADRVVRGHPYQTIGIAFGVGLLLGFLAKRK
jgi:ElaB/YqjD/DUF883 family membrane-anchored ribosome-binding protein